MKIVAEGTVPYDLRGVCERCRCVVEAMYSDPEVKCIPDYEDGNAPHRCDCPTEGCGWTIYLWKNR